MSWSSWTVAIGVGLASITVSGCAARPRMCTATRECTTPSACVAGRCQSEKPNVKPAIDAARRLVVAPVDLAYVRRGAESGGRGLPPLFALGTDAAVLMMRFSVALPIHVRVMEAYVVLRRSDAVDDDPAPIFLHATRIVEGWESGSISWARQPRVVDARSPATVVEPGGPSLVRLDVLDLVRQWPRHDERDQGIAVVADNETRSGTTFAFRGISVDRSSSPDLASAGQRSSSALGSAPALEPYLELYVR